MIKILANILLAAVVPAATVFKPFPIPADAYLMDVAFADGGKTMYVTQISGAAHTIVVSTLQQGTWSAPKPASFSGQWRDLEEVLSPDGRTMIFASNRPANGDKKAIDAYFGHKFRPARGGNLWQTSWDGTSWSDPVRLPDGVNANTSTFSPALAGDGTLYFMRASGPKFTFHIFVANRVSGKYSTSTLAPFSDYSYSDVDPTVAPDNSFVVFSSNRPPAPQGTSGLFIAYNHDGTWSAPRYIGEKIAPDGAVEPRLSPDLKTLYFMAGNTPQLWSADVSSFVRPAI
jgi:Tol biopolymer transport system component